jgi:hypothetical protein
MDKRVEELKPWVRVVTSVYVIALVPTLLAVFVLMLISAPRMFATAWDSFFVQVGSSRARSPTARSSPAWRASCRPSRSSSRCSGSR